MASLFRECGKNVQLQYLIASSLTSILTRLFKAAFLSVTSTVPIQMVKINAMTTFPHEHILCVGVGYILQ
jgi:hypothetical protein